MHTNFKATYCEGVYNIIIIVMDSTLVVNLVSVRPMSQTNTMLDGRVVIYRVDHTGVVSELIITGSEGYNPYARYAECCSLLAQQGAVLETADTSYGRTAAHWSIYYHRDDILAVLIEAGEDN